MSVISGHVTDVPLGVSLLLALVGPVLETAEASCVCESGLITASCFIITTCFGFPAGYDGEERR